MASAAAFSIVPGSGRTVLRFARNGEVLTEVEFKGEPPPWLAPTTGAMTEILELPENWDSYGARPIDPEAVTRALQILDKVMDPETPPPTVIPTSQGGIEIEWHLHGIDLEAHALAPSGVYVYYEDQVCGTRWERQLSSDFSPLRGALSQLSRRA